MGAIDQSRHCLLYTSKSSEEEIASGIQNIQKEIEKRTEKKGKTFMEKMIRAAKAGEPDAFTRLMKSQMQSMYKTAGAILMNDEDIADAVSDRCV